MIWQNILLLVLAGLAVLAVVGLILWMKFRCKDEQPMADPYQAGEDATKKVSDAADEREFDRDQEKLVDLARRQKAYKDLSGQRKKLADQSEEDVANWIDEVE